MIQYKHKAVEESSNDVIQKDTSDEDDLLLEDIIFYILKIFYLHSINKEDEFSNIDFLSIPSLLLENFNDFNICTKQYIFLFLSSCISFEKLSIDENLDTLTKNINLSYRIDTFDDFKIDLLELTILILQYFMDQSLPEMIPEIINLDTIKIIKGYFEYTSNEEIKTNSLLFFIVLTQNQQFLDYIFDEDFFKLLYQNMMEGENSAKQYICLLICEFILTGWQDSEYFLKEFFFTFFKDIICQTIDKDVLYTKLITFEFILRNKTEFLEDNAEIIGEIFEEINDIDNTDEEIQEIIDSINIHFSKSD